MQGGAQAVTVPYCGAAPAPAELLARWNVDPPLLAALAAALFWYLVVGRRHGVSGAFPTAIAGLALLFVSPFCALTSALFAARSAHHALLIAAIAPLIAWSVPEGRLRVPLSLGWSTAIAAVTLWAWHVPPLYAAALSHEGIYWLMQASLLATACAFWISVRQAGAVAAVAALLATMVQMGLLGALLTFTGRALYAPHAGTTLAWGLSPLEDQQLAGLIMWAPAAALYLLAALAITGRWLRDAGRPA